MLVPTTDQIDPDDETVILVGTIIIDTCLCSLYTFLFLFLCNSIERERERERERTLFSIALSFIPALKP